MDCGFIFLVLLPASLFDLFSYRIPNYLLGFGLIYSLIRRLELQGLNSVWPWLAGMIIPLFLYYLFFRLRVFGASDGKFVAVIGSYVGLPGVFFVLFFSLIIGAIISIIKISMEHSFFDRYYCLKKYVKDICCTRKITPYYNREKMGDAGVIPFGVALGFGTLIYGFVFDCFVI